jgi:hypothetical protein
MADHGVVCSGRNLAWASVRRSSGLVTELSERGLKVDYRTRDLVHAEKLTQKKILIAAAPQGA